MNVESRKITYGVLIVIIILVLFLGVTPLFSPFEASVTIGNESDGSTTTTTTGTTGGTSGGGSSGGTGPTPIADFSIDKSLIEIQLTQGQSKIETVTIENIGDVNLSFNIDAVDAIIPFISLGDQSFELLPGELRIITFAFLAEENEPPGVYTGRIDLITTQLTKSINIALQILEKEALFDLSSELKDDTLTKVQQIEASISMIDIAGVGNVNVLLEYFIKDFSDNATKISEETLEVDGILKIERAFPIPEILKIGEEYVFYVRLTYQDSVATSANVFKVIDVIRIYNSFLWIIVLIIISIFAFWIFYGRKERG